MPRRKRLDAEAARRLRQLVKKYPDTQAQLCRKAGIEPSTLTRFMAKERDIMLSTAERLCRALGVELTIKE